MKNGIICEFGHIKYKIMRPLNEGFFAKIRNKKLKNKHFTIISNNCWGGYIYRLFSLPYQSPTIGLFIMPEDYIKFIKKLEYYIKECQLSFIEPNKSHNYEYLKNTPNFGEYPIGTLDDIEICFMHYKNKKEAVDKWNRRCKRINWKNIIIKFNDQNGCTLENIKQFNDINKYKKMVCFTAAKINGRYNIQMQEFKNAGYVLDDKYFVFQHINLKKLIES